MDKKNYLSRTLKKPMKVQRSPTYHSVPLGDDRTPFIPSADNENAWVRQHQVRFKTNETPVTKEKDTARKTILLEKPVAKGILKVRSLTDQNGPHQSRSSQIGNKYAAAPQPSTSGSRNFPSGQGSNRGSPMTQATNVKWGPEIVPHSEHKKLKDLLHEMTKRLSGNFEFRAERKRMPLQTLIGHVSTLNELLKEGGQRDCVNPLLRFMMALEPGHFKDFLDGRFKALVAVEVKKQMRQHAAEHLQETSLNLEVPNATSEPVNDFPDDSCGTEMPNMNLKPSHPNAEANGYCSWDEYEEIKFKIDEMHESPDPEVYDHSRHSPNGIQNHGELSFVNQVINFPREDGRLNGD